MATGSSPTARRAAHILLLLLPPLLPAALAFFQIVNGDIGFHVATGRYIDLAGRLPDSNVLSFAEPAHPWVLHQFLPAWLFHRVELWLGRDMLVAVKAVLVYLTFLFLWDAMGRRLRAMVDGRWSMVADDSADGNARTGCMATRGTGELSILAAGGWLLALAAGAAACRFFVRPFLFSDLGLAILLALLARYEEDRRPVRLVQAALVTGAFAPLHAGVIYLLLVLLAFAAGEGVTWALRRYLGRRAKGRQATSGPRKLLRSGPLADSAAGTATAPTGGLTARSPADTRPSPFPWGPVLVLPGALVAAGVALMLSDPSGLEALTLPFKFSVHPYFHEHLVEFRPFPFDLARHPFAWGLVALSVVLGVGGWGLGVGAALSDRAREGVEGGWGTPRIGAKHRGCLVLARRWVRRVCDVMGAGPACRLPSDGARPCLFEILLLVGFTLLLLRHQRMVFEYALVAAFVLVRWAGVLLATVGRDSGTGRGTGTGTGGDSGTGRGTGTGTGRGTGTDRGRDSGTGTGTHTGALAPMLRNLLLLAAGLISAGALAHQYSSARFGLGVDDRFYPARLFSFVRQHNLPDPAYVSDAWGGHWLWEFYPERRVFYDNRLEAYSFEFFRDVYQSIRYGESGWQEKLDAYGIETMVLKYTTPGERKFQEGKPNVRDLAFASPDWDLVFWDDLGMVCVRQGAGVGGQGSASASWPALRSLGKVGSQSQSSYSSSCPTCFRFSRFNPDTLSPVAGWDDPGLGRELKQAFALATGERSGYALTVWLLGQERVPEAADVLSKALAVVPDSPLLTGLAEKLADRR